MAEFVFVSLFESARAIEKAGADDLGIDRVEIFIGKLLQVNDPLLRDLRIEDFLIEHTGGFERSAAGDHYAELARGARRVGIGDLIRNDETRNSHIIQRMKRFHRLGRGIPSSIGLKCANTGSVGQPFGLRAIGVKGDGLIADGKSPHVDFLLQAFLRLRIQIDWIDFEQRVVGKGLVVLAEVIRVDLHVFTLLHRLGVPTQFDATGVESALETSSMAQ
jgi:hypothetical protein